MHIAIVAYYSLFLVSNDIVVHAKDVNVKHGEPVQIAIDITYVGSKGCAISAESYKSPCVYEVPAEWNPIPVRVRPLGLAAGMNFAWLRPNDKFSRLVNVSDNYFITAKPGKYTIPLKVTLWSLDSSGRKNGEFTASTHVTVNILPEDK